MTTPVLKATTLVTADGVAIDTVHLPGREADWGTGPVVPESSGGLAIVVAHGFTGSWQRPALWSAATRLRRFGGVVAFDFRGHGRSGGASTLGDLEIHDVDAAVAYARELGYEQVATVGFSMGASVVLRHAGLIGGADAVVSISGPGRWHYKGTRPMRWVHRAIEHRAGRLFARTRLDTRISGGRWDTEPVPPAEAAARVTPVPLLIVHGDQDAFFPVDHAEQLYAGARDPKELWIVPGYGHAEAAATPALLDRVGRWILAALPAAGPAAVPATTPVA